jgi:hypothetical protein
MTIQSHAFLPLWLGAFASLGIALILLSTYFRVLGTDLALNRITQELVLALVVSAAQAGVLRFVLPYVHGAQHAASSARGVFIFPMLFCILLYRLAHLAEWDQYEPLGLAFFQYIVAYVGVLVFSGDFGLATFVLTGFAMALLLIGAFVKQT